jgi:hypothetical protein
VLTVSLGSIAQNGSTDLAFSKYSLGIRLREPASASRITRVASLRIGVP